MKVILSSCIALLVYFGSDFNVLKLVDLDGVYYSENISADIFIESLALKDGHFFEYKCSYVDGSKIITQAIIGSYSIQRDLIQFFPDTFMVDSKEVENNRKATLASFESGTLRFQPRYYFKQYGGEVSLCRKDVKTAQYQALFLKGEES